MSVAFAATLLLKLGGGDIWWHLKTGQWIVEHGAIPDVDPFSHTSAGPWRYTDALAQILYAGAHSLAGAEGLVALHALLGGARAVLVALLARGHAPARALVVGVWGAASHAAMAAKPQIFSYLGFALLLWWLDRAERSERPLRWLAWLPVLFVLWGNLHRGGTLGLAVLAAGVVTWALQRDRRRHAALLAGVGVACAAALLLNPGGTFYLSSAVDLATRSSFSELLADWQPLSWKAVTQQHLVLLALVPLAAIGLRDRIRHRGIDVLVAIGTAALAIHSVRFVPFFAVALVPSAGCGAQRLLSWIESVASRRVRPGLVSAMAITLSLAALGWRYTTQVPPAYWGAGIVDSRVPVGPAEHLREHPPPGEMLNAFDLGGYLLYALAPEQRVFIDGRNDTVYSDRFFRRALATATSPEALEHAVATHDVGYAVVPFSGPGDARYAFLHADPRWQLVYFDDAGAVLVKRSEQSSAYLTEHGFRELSLHDAFQRAAILGDAPGDRLLAREIADQAERHPSSLTSTYLAAILYRRVGNGEAYRAQRRRVAELAAERSLSLPPP